MALFILLIALACPFAAMMIASGKGRSAVGWFALGCILGPFAVLGAAMISSDGRRDVRAGLQSGRLRTCTMCAEPIQREAIKCRHCGSAQQPLAPQGLFARPSMEDRLTILEAQQERAQ